MTHRMSGQRGLLCAGALLVLGAALPCRAQKLQIVAPKDVNLASYKTYEWLPVKMLGKTGVIEDQPVFSPLVNASVNRELQARGMKEVQSGGDLQVAIFGLAESVPQLEAVIFPANVAIFTDFSDPAITVGRYNREGTLVINLIDPKTKKSAWAAMVKQTLKTNPGAGKEKIDPAVRKIFDKYPVKKVK